MMEEPSHIMVTKRCRPAVSMKRLCFTLMCIFGLGFADQAVCQDYYLVATSKDGLLTSFIDKSSVKRHTDGTVTAWLTAVYPKDGVINNVKYEALFERFSCENETSQILSVLQYDVNQKVLNSSDQEMDISRSPPGTIGNDQMLIACDLNRLGDKQPVHNLEEMIKGARLGRAIATGVVLGLDLNAPE